MAYKAGAIKIQGFLKPLLFLLALIVGLSACQKDPSPSWDTELLFPVAKTSLSISELLPDSIVKANPDNSFSLVYQAPVYVFAPTSIEEFPDTTFSLSYQNNLFGFDVYPGQELFPPKIDQTVLNVKNVQLSQLIIKSGKTKFEVTSTIQGPTEIIYGLPHVKKNGQSFYITIKVPGGTVNGPGKYEGEFDLSGYIMDLRGSGNKVNTVETYFLAKIPDNAASQLRINTGEGIVIKNTMAAIKPYYAKGYFGKETYKSGPVESEFSFLKKIDSGSISFEDMKVGLVLNNGVGVDARVRLNKLASINTKNNKTINLSHPIVGSPININRAVDKLWQNPAVKPSLHRIDFTTSNSNFKQLVENVPDKLLADFDIVFNPLENISGGNDFLHADYGFSVILDFEMPLSFSSNKLTLVDTVEINLTENSQRDRIMKGQLTILAENSFPFDASAMIIMLDTNNKVLGVVSAEELQVIRAGLVNAETGIISKQTPSRVVYILDEKMVENLFKARKLVIKSTFTTQPQGKYTRIYSHYKLDIKVTAKLQYLNKFD
jgi:hypothetical protein